MSAQFPTRMERVLWGVEYAALMATRFLIRPLDSDARISLAGWLGRRIVANLPPARRRIQKNIDLVLPGLDTATRNNLILGVGDNFGRVLGEYECLNRIAYKAERYPLSGPGLAALNLAQSEGRGVVLVSAHYGSWEAIRIALKAQGHNCAMIYRAFNNPKFDRDVRGQMIHAGTPVLVKGRSGMRKFVTHVARGGIALILVDQKQTGAPHLPFMGQPAETVLAAADLATRYDAALIPARGHRQPNGQSCDVTLEKPIDAGDGLTRMTEINARITEWIRDDPAQWLWLHRRWRIKTDPR